MKGRTPTAEERRYLTRIVAQGCIICRLYHDVDEPVPAEVHHIDGKTVPGAHFRSIPLCVPHHRHGQSGGEYVYATRHGPGRYAGKAQFELYYDTEENILERVHEMAGIP